MSQLAVGNAQGPAQTKRRHERLQAIVRKRLLPVGSLMLAHTQERPLVSQLR